MHTEGTRHLAPGKRQVLAIRTLYQQTNFDRPIQDLCCRDPGASYARFELGSRLVQDSVSNDRAIAGWQAGNKTHNQPCNRACNLTY